MQPAPPSIPRRVALVTAGSITAELTTRGRLLGMAIAAGTAGAACFLLVNGWDNWAPLLLLAVPTVAAWTVRRISLLASLYLAQMAMYYGVTWLIQRPDRSPYLIALVVTWAIGLALGARLGRGKLRVAGAREWPAPRWPQFILTAGLVAVQGVLVLSGQLGIAGQFNVGISTPADVFGILSTAGPVVSLMLLATALSTRRHAVGAVMLAMLQALVLALAGYRSAPVVYIIAAFATTALTLPSTSSWRRPRRAIPVLVALILVAVMGFIVGAQIKDAVATTLGRSSEGTQLFSLDEAIPYVTKRLDLGGPLEKAVQYRDDRAVEEAVWWGYQLQALVPRFLWPSKPVIDYDQRVSVAVYGYHYGQTSSTISTIGDTLVNFTFAGVVVCSVLLGFAISIGERRIRNGESVLALVLAAGLSYSIVFSLETPLIVSAAGLLRNLLVAGVLWRASHLVARGHRGQRESGTPMVVQL